MHHSHPEPCGFEYATTGVMSRQSSGPFGQQGLIQHLNSMSQLIKNPDGIHKLRRSDFFTLISFESAVLKEPTFFLGCTHLTTRNWTPLSLCQLFVLRDCLSAPRISPLLSPAWETQAGPSLHERLVPRKYATISIDC